MSTASERGGQDSTSGSASEPLACVTCRSRKLKCDRLKPACGRCTKVNSECVYPESRRKPAFKRRNVRELEERLAQVECMLKEKDSEQTSPLDGNSDFSALPGQDASENMNFPFGVSDYTVDLESFLAAQSGGNEEPTPPPFRPPPGVMPMSVPPLDADDLEERDASASELIGLGLFEQLPPFEIMEELNTFYFSFQSSFIPIIHPTRYLQSFYSAPHKKPPMCLQYAVWTMASNSHPKYGSYHDVFYERARHYADVDEMRGYGEHFITIQHAQAWALIATDEARNMYFTRAAMSCAKTVRLVEMMGLHRLDGPPEEIVPVLSPPKSWIELEERRRTFWGAFCIDSHASISTGWPTLIDSKEVTTLLPASEEAFQNCKEEKSPTLDEVFKGASYSPFAGAVVICYIFNRILKHVHRPKPTDNPENVEYGDFWNRHRELDNTLSSAFMFLPDRFRLPDNLRDPTAVHTNLNLHASVICLHHAAVDKIDTHKLAPSLKAISLARLKTAAEEVISIVKLTSHITSSYKSPLVALSMYCAASVYIYHAKNDPDNPLSKADFQNLDFIIRAMEAIGRQHLITRAFLQQVCLDIERNNLQTAIQMPNLSKYRTMFGQCSSNIPLLVRSSISRHTEPQPPLPGRLPLDDPVGSLSMTAMASTAAAPGFGGQAGLKKFDFPTVIEPDGDRDNDREEGSSNKRKRMLSPTPERPAGPDKWPGESGSGSGKSKNPAYPGGLFPEFTSAPAEKQPVGGTFNASLINVVGVRLTNKMNLPHRTGSTASSSPAQTTPAQSGSGNGSGSGSTPAIATTDSGSAREGFESGVLEDLMADFESGEPWSMLHEGDETANMPLFGGMYGR